MFKSFFGTYSKISIYIDNSVSEYVLYSNAYAVHMQCVYHMH